MVRVATVVARTEFRRTLRIVAGDRTKLLVFAALALFALGPITVIGTLLLSAAGEQVAAGAADTFELVTVTDAVSGFSALVWLVVMILTTMRTTTAVADLDEPACLLLSTPLVPVVVGLIGAEMARVGVWLFVPAVVLSSAFASGAGSLLPVVVTPLFVLVVLSSAVPVGFLLGIWVRHLLTVYEPIARYRTHVFVALGVAYFGAIALGWLDAITTALFSLLVDTPLGWPGHLLLVAVPTVSPAIGALVGALVGTVLLATVSVSVAVASARVHWYADPARPDDSSDGGRGRDRGYDHESGTSRLEEVLERGLERPTQVVALTAIRRTRRAPVRLLYVAYPLLGSLFFVGDVVQTRTLPSFVALALCLYVVWGAGALFTLNPLGDHGRALPTALTSTLSGRAAVGGLIAAGALLTVPLAVVVSLTVGLASPLSLSATGALLVATVAGTLAAPALAVGVGSVFPRFGSVRVTNEREAVMPSKAAFFVYTLAVMIPTAAAGVLATDTAPEVLAGVVTALLTLVPWIDLVVPAGAVTAVAWSVLPLGLLAPVVSWRYATRRFDRYTLE